MENLRSIVILTTVHNRAPEHYLKRFVASVYGQLDGDDQLLIGSDPDLVDRCMSVVRGELALHGGADLSKVKVIPTEGPLLVRQAELLESVRYAPNQYVMRLGDDDWINPGYLTKLRTKCVDYWICTFYAAGQIVHEDGDGNILHSQTYEPPCGDELTRQLCSSATPNPLMVQTCAVSLPILEHYTHKLLRAGLAQLDDWPMWKAFAYAGLPFHLVRMQGAVKIGGATWSIRPNSGGLTQTIDHGAEMRLAAAAGLFPEAML